MIPPIPLNSKRFALRLAPVFNVSASGLCLGVASSRSLTTVSVNVILQQLSETGCNAGQMRQPKDYDKAVSFPTDLHDLVVRRGQTPGFQTDAGDRHYENLRAGMRGLFTELGVAA
jgi:hypothetical protein